jgi:hypothetical protein
MDYSHPHPLLQGPTAQGQADPQVQLQPQEQLPDFVVISVMVVLSLSMQVVQPDFVASHPC